jgi:hypothetical protein
MWEAIFGKKDFAAMFAFNLLPPRSKEELDLESQRVDGVLNSFIALFAVLVFAALAFIFNLLFVQRNVDNWQKSLTDVKSELGSSSNTLGELKRTNGELKTKTEFISEAVQKNVDFALVFQVTKDVFGTDKAVVTSYGREDNGEFVVNAISTDPTSPSKILDAYKKQPQVKQATLKLVDFPDASKDIRFTISFELTNLSITPTP